MSAPESSLNSRASKQDLHKPIVESCCDTETFLQQLTTLFDNPPLPSPLFPRCDAGASKTPNQESDLSQLVNGYTVHTCTDIAQGVLTNLRNLLDINVKYLDALNELFKDAAEPTVDGGLTESQLKVIYDTLVRTITSTSELKVRITASEELLKALAGLPDYRELLSTCGDAGTIVLPEVFTQLVKATLERVKLEEKPDRLFVAKIEKWNNVLRSRGILEKPDCLAENEISNGISGLEKADEPAHDMLMRDDVSLNSEGEVHDSEEHRNEIPVVSLS